MNGGDGVDWRPPEALESPATAGHTVHDRRLRRLLDYWTNKCAGRTMPARTDVDPVEMRFILGHVMLFEVVRPGPRFRVRLQGSELTWWIGRELTGETLDQAPERDLERLAQERLAHVVAGAAPLSSDGTEVDMLLASVRCGLRAPKP
jgi:hypothetical protein